MGNITETDRTQKDLGEEESSHCFPGFFFGGWGGGFGFLFGCGLFWVLCVCLFVFKLESTKTTTGQMPTPQHSKLLSYFRQKSKPLSHSPRVHCWLWLTLSGSCNDRQFQLYLHCTLQYYLKSPRLTNLLPHPKPAFLSKNLYHSIQRNKENHC